MKTLMIKIDDMINPLRKLASCIGAPLLDLTFRLYVAHAFFISGIGRFKDYLNGSWDTQLFLFELEHPVPGIDPAIAAPLSTGAELVLPVLLALGLFGRFGAAGLLIMTLIIEFTYQHNTEHLLWMAMLATILIRGPGLISLDTLLLKWLRK